MFFYLDKNSPYGFRLRDTLKGLRWGLTLGYRLGLLGPGSRFSGMLLQAWKFIKERLQQYSCFPSYYEIFKGHLQTPASLNWLFQIGGILIVGCGSASRSYIWRPGIAEFTLRSGFWLTLISELWFVVSVHIVSCLFYG